MRVSRLPEWASREGEGNGEGEHRGAPVRAVRAACFAVSDAQTGGVSGVSGISDAHDGHKPLVAIVGPGLSDRRARRGRSAARCCHVKQPDGHVSRGPVSSPSLRSRAVLRPSPSFRRCAAGGQPAPETRPTQRDLVAVGRLPPSELWRPCSVAPRVLLHSCRSSASVCRVQSAVHISLRMIAAV